MSAHHHYILPAWYAYFALVDALVIVALIALAWLAKRKDEQE